MKLKTQYKKIILFSAIVLLGACSGEEALKESQLDVSIPAMSTLDKWIETNYVNTYNIKVQYKWNQNVVDNNRFLYPPIQGQVQPALEIVQKIWLESYSTIGGADFVKKIAPREFVLVGGRNLNTTGTITLGLAEGGQRITLFETDLVDKKNRDNVKRFVHTIQHEYIHILNQYKPFDEKTLSKITPTGYTSNWYATSTTVAREEGFITDYARSNINEDFAEMASTMLVNSKAEYDAIIAGITSVKAKADIKAKEAVVVKYFKDAFNIDFYKLRDEAEKNTLAVING
ncbi:putative zinc-binding metallopeptidase [Flavobacterium sinopsychrotolerans]|uniref:Substrate import-associated zinc metallohydrolase lipoprotein n=1 Tax=Flavobacterium sinopsychrotolerans TaxID=604089 RepID=A0A1H8KDS0_9FLAO|nr:putative zinc-binding metallopeptidase [Flavobacterium sinopsychrotolerans]SEN91044.1 substrate import-associated zinc metallohydrolase lipoprotein [Flavobacterium sinopsychrotolerans]